MIYEVIFEDLIFGAVLIPDASKTKKKENKKAIPLQAWAGPLQAWAGPYRPRRLRLPEFLDSCYMKVVRLSALLTGRLYPLRSIPGTHFC
jgi:hypothetical protein